MLLGFGISFALAVLMQASGANAGDGVALIDKNICGPLALAGAAAQLGRPDMFEEVFGILPSDGRLRSLRDLAEAANSVGLRTRTIRWRAGIVPGLPGPAIIRLEPSAGVGSGHFVLMTGVSGRRVLILDLPHKPKWVPIETLDGVWDGVALHLAARDGSLPSESDGGRRNLVIACLVTGSLALGIMGWKRYRQGSPLSARRGGWRNLLLTSATACGLVGAALSSRIEPATGTDPLELAATPPAREITVSASDFAGSSRKVPFTFTIVNRGLATAKVRGVATSCGCASPVVSAREVRPGESIEVTANVEPTPGQVRVFTISVEFGRPHERTIELTGRLGTR